MKNANAKIIAVSSLMCLLTGCSQLQDRIDKEVLDRTYICDEHNEDYARYLDNDKIYQANRKEYDDILNSDTSDDEEAVAAMGGEIIPGGILISFGQNSFMNTRFYIMNGAAKEPVEEDSCYITPGGSIYAEAPEIISTNANYRFKEYRVRTDENTGIKFVPSEDGYILKIPTDISAEKISILPIGEYTDREIKCTLFRIDENGNKTSVSGEWDIDGGYCEKETNDIETLLRFAPTFNYTVKFNYDDDNYYIDPEKTSPSIFTDNEGEVSFEEMSSDQAPPEYHAALRRYSVINFSGEYIKGVHSKQVNNDEQDFYDEKNPIIGKLKLGDTFAIEVNEGYSFTSSVPSSLITEEHLNSGVRYSFKIDKENMSVKIVKGDNVDPVIIPSFDHVTTRLFSADNRNTVELVDGSSISGNDLVRVEMTPDPGYVFIGKNVSGGVYITEMKYSDYQGGKKINNILDDQLKKYYSIELPEKDEHGTFTYELDGKAIPAGKCKYYEGQKLTAVLTITDTSKYKIVRPELFGFSFGNDTSDSGSKELTVEDSTKTVTADFFGIKVIAR